jgi:hypothetical protein
MMPRRRSFSTTGRQPIFRSAISRAAASTVSSGWTATGGADMTRAISTPCRKARRRPSSIPDRFESEARSRSRSETTPTSLPPCTTGMWRTRPNVMISSTVDNASLSLIVTMWAGMMSRTRAPLMK